MKRIHIYVSGLVQGVYFRYSTRIKAEELGLKGWVRNLADGKVEILCEGQSDSIDIMTAWCKIGPQGSCVEYLEIYEEEFKNEFNRFRIEY